MGELVPPGATIERLEVDGGSVRLLRGGSQGRPVILLHGAGTTSSAIAWYRVFDALSARHRVTAIDFPGHGGSTGLEPEGNPDVLADFVARIMHELGLTDAVVIGGSMGGETALNLARQHRELVRALVLISPAGLQPVIGNRAVQAAAWLYTRLPERVAVLQSRAFSHFGPPLRGIVGDPDALPPELVAEIGREARRPHSGLSLHRYIRATIGRTAMLNNLLPVIDRITVPTLFVHGEHDRQQPPATSLQAARLMPNARRVLIPDCGHWAQLEAPDTFLTEIDGFLDDLG